MIPESAAKLDSFFGGFEDAKRSLLLLDYDGTLAPFRVNRFEAKPWAGVRELLGGIQGQGRTRIVMITGRPAGEIAPLLGLEPALEVWGLHGAERLHPDGRREVEEAPAATRVALEALKEHLRRDALGGLFEDKANGAVMHWRAHSRQKKAEIERRTRELFEPLARMGGLALLEFESGLELRAGRDKGGAVSAILGEVESPGPVAFLGDDLSDESAFRAVQRAGRRGLSVLVRREWRDTAAEVWLRPPTELKEFLLRWLQAGQRFGGTA